MGCRGYLDLYRDGPRSDSCGNWRAHTPDGPAPADILLKPGPLDAAMQACTQYPPPGGVAPYGETAMSQHHAFCLAGVRRLDD